MSVTEQQKYETHLLVFVINVQCFDSTAHGQLGFTVKIHLCCYEAGRHSDRATYECGV